MKENFDQLHIKEALVEDAREHRHKKEHAEKYPSIIAENDSASAPKEGFLTRIGKSRIGKRAKKLFLGFGLIASLAGMGISREAIAEEIRKQPVASDIDIKSIRQANLEKGKRKIFFARTESRPTELDGKKGRETASIIKISDRRKTGETDIEARLYRFESGEKSSWAAEIKNEGYDERMNDLGNFNPAKYEGRGNASMAREIFRSEAQKIWEQKEILNAMRQVGEDDSPEATYLKTELRREFQKMAKRFPGQELNRFAVENALGGELKMTKMEEAETRIPAALVKDDIPKSGF